MKKHIKITQLLPVLFGFFVMGFVDIVGISTSYVKNDFALSDTLANLLPMMVFLWFAVFSLPTGIFMGKAGRKKTVLTSCIITVVAMIIPMVAYTFPFVLFAFALLGIGNTILQVSLNPLVTDIVPENRITSTLTLGYFVKAVSSFLGPVLISIVAGFWGNWKFVFLIYAATTVISLVWLWLTPVKEKATEVKQESESRKIVSLLKNRLLLCMFSVILLCVGFEVGLMTAVPKYLQERFLMPLEQGGMGCSVYYAARTLGTLSGSVLLVYISSRKFMIVTVAGAMVSFILLLLSWNSWIFMVSLFFLGLMFANVFSIAFSNALKVVPSKANEISALMITGVAGGALIPPVMGVIADAGGQLASFSVLLVALAYIFWASVFFIQK